MAEESNAPEVDRSLIAWIVRGYVAHHSARAAQLADLISEGHRSLNRLGKLRCRKSLSEQYRACWKLPADHPITAPAYSERRSTMAKRIGFGRRPRQAAVSTPALEVMALPPKRPAANRARRPRSSSLAAVHGAPKAPGCGLYPAAPICDNVVYRTHETG